MAEYESAYSPYPDALLHMRHITTIGVLITAGVTPPPTAEMDANTPKDQPSSTREATELSAIATGASSIEADDERDIIVDASIGIGPFHQISKLMWHATNVLLLLKNKSVEEGTLDLALEKMAENVNSLEQEEWYVKYDTS